MGAVFVAFGDTWPVLIAGSVVVGICTGPLLGACVAVAAAMLIGLQLSRSPVAMPVTVE